MRRLWSAEAAGQPLVYCIQTCGRTAREQLELSPPHVPRHKAPLWRDLCSQADRRISGQLCAHADSTGGRQVRRSAVHGRGDGHRWRGRLFGPVAQLACANLPGISTKLPSGIGALAAMAGVCQKKDVMTRNTDAINWYRAATLSCVWFTTGNPIQTLSCKWIARNQPVAGSRPTCFTRRKLQNNCA